MDIDDEQLSVPLRMGRIYTRICGRPSGPPVVLVHGLVLAGDYMMPTARVLAPFSRTFVPDLPGYGLSDRPRQHLDLPFLGDRLAEWMEQLKLHRAHFVGNSFGCQILVDFAARHSRFVQRLVLQGPTVDPAARSVVTQVCRLVKNSRIESPRLGRLMLRDYWRAGWRGIAAAVRMALHDRPESKLPQISAPTLVVRGSLDVLVSQDWVERMVRLLPDGHLLVLPGLAHTINYTAPTMFVNAIRPFLRL
ncbi:MAG TPA: alpha/beta hydrolase [Nitrospira sp.]|nr:alpha/beta hydrolase [Nitrospira sp.]